MSKDKDLRTRLVHTRSGGRLNPTVNPPVERASTLLMPDIGALYDAKTSYGRKGLAVHRELEAGLCTLENAISTRLTPNGLSACALAAASAVRAGDHILVADNVYGPSRRFCERRLPAMGVAATIFPARSGMAELEAMIRPETRAIYLESPGSLTFELCDTHAIVALAGKHGLTTIMDNTWGCGVLHRPLDLGIDISVQALTKYVVGHADSFGGAVMTASGRMSERVGAVADDWGLSLGPDDAWLALRGLRTLVPRLAQHDASGREIALWLRQQPGIAAVLHPALPDHPDHALWQRDFSGANGLFGFVLEDRGEAARQAFYANLALFGFGFSWGGYESLLIPADPRAKRCDGHWLDPAKGTLARIHVGLEAPADLIADLDRALAAFRA